MIKLGVLPVRSLLVTEDTLWAASGGQVFVIGVETLGVQVSSWACCAGGAGASSPGPGSPERRRLGLVPAHGPWPAESFFQTWLGEMAPPCGRRRGRAGVARAACGAADVPDAVPSEPGGWRDGEKGFRCHCPGFWPCHVLFSVLKCDTHLTVACSGPSLTATVPGQTPVTRGHGQPRG